MAIATIPAVASPVKSVQRGSAAGAGSVTITSVDIAKSFCNIFGTTSSGTVAATGAVGGITGTIGGNVGARTGTVYYRTRNYTGNQGNYGAAGPGVAQNANVSLSAPSLSGNLSGNASNITGGTNNLVAAVVQGFLANATTLTVSGACRYEVVEFN